MIGTEANELQALGRHCAGRKARERCGDVDDDSTCAISWFGQAERTLPAKGCVILVLYRMVLYIYVTIIFITIRNFGDSVDQELDKWCFVGSILLKLCSGGSYPAKGIGD